MNVEDVKAAANVAVGGDLRVLVLAENDVAGIMLEKVQRAMKLIKARKLMGLLGILV